MKKVYLWIIMPFFISCTTDRIESMPAEINAPNLMKPLSTYPNNPANEFDQAGALHNALSECYVIGGTLPSTVGATLISIDSIANHNALFHEIKGIYYTVPASSRLEYVLEQSDIDLEDVLANSSLSGNAKAYLISFIAHVQAFETAQTEYASMYRYIVDEEDKVINNNIYSQNDLELLLITTSITRHAAYFAREQKRKPRDRDWDLVIANIIAATEVAEKGIATAAVMAATAGIFSNY